LVKPVFSHLTDRSLELLLPLGVTAPKVQWMLPIPETARNWSLRWRRTVPSTRLAVLNPGATAYSKMWEADRFGATAKYLSQRYGFRSVVVWGNSQERVMAEQIVAHSEGTAVLAPDTDLHHLAALIATSDLFISGDTGPLHLAVAVGTPTIGLYGSTRPGDSGPYGQIALQKAYEGGSRRHRRSADNHAMRQIHVRHVCEAIDEIEDKRRLISAA
jgi:ADP-heptose:LPS heptosyltransferase